MRGQHAQSSENDIFGLSIVAMTIDSFCFDGQ